jgi:predicted MFS family arabinose efflux permease
MHPETARMKLSGFASQRYAFVVAGVTFVTMLTVAGVRSAPGVLMVPWENAFGWDRSTVSGAAAVGIFLYGLMGPFAAALMQSFGVRRTMTVALALLSLSACMSLFMTERWQLVATWGVLSGLGSGCVAFVLAATIVNRWFTSNRGLVMGILSASTATGNLVFLPALAKISEHGWRPVVIAIALATAALIPVVLLLMPERPSDIGTEPYGALPGTPPEPEAARTNPLRTALATLAAAARVRDFWLLLATFFICGFTTHGLIGTHLIPMCADYGIGAVQAASLLAVMGVCDLIGTTASGWLTDRYDARTLLFIYYGLRGLSLIYLPYTDFTFYGLSLFAVFYGLDWVATVPPTLRLTNAAFGDKAAPIVFGWIAAGHQMGAASAAFLGGALRTAQGTYIEAFFIAGAAGLLAAVLSLLIARPLGGPRLGPVTQA